jgi:hypothetical protein
MSMDPMETSGMRSNIDCEHTVKFLGGKKNKSRGMTTT